MLKIARRIMKKTNKILFVAIPIVVTILAIFLILYFLCDCNGNKGTITIDKGGEVSREYVVTNLALYPGNQEVTELNVKSKLSGNFEVTLEFREINDGALKNFVTVEVLFDGEVKVIKNLCELFDGNKITFDCNISSSSRSNLKIIYKMPIETGDTAQDTTASFNVGLKIEKK